MRDPEFWSVNEQRLLYRAVRRLIGQRVYLRSQPGAASYEPTEGKLTFEWLSATAFDERASRPGWEDNFRAGRLSKKKAAAIFAWLERHFSDEARVLVNEITRAYGAATQQPWEQFIREHGVFGFLIIDAPRERSSRIITLEPDDEQELAQVSARVPLHRPFRFGLLDEADFNASGGRSLLGLQWVRGQWFALRLSPDRLGSRARDAQVDDVLLGPKLIENDEPGLHRFVFIETMESDGAALERMLVPDAPLSEPVLADLMEALGQLRRDRFRLHRLNAMFVIAEHHPYE